MAGIAPQARVVRRDFLQAQHIEIGVAAQFDNALRG